ncbi:alpha/beta hydrolase [Promicromonospora sp. NPDC090134]|uniref:alpha/beta hydrolase n=1 Tax=Promicromonospora sp. NPDC090134 TaxID=3364408 RepID=UPI003806058E
MTTSRIPVIFVHGLWIHSSAWEPWIEKFRSVGLQPVAPGWPGDHETVAETRAQPEQLAGVGLESIAAHYSNIIDAMDQPPIVIGHSIGGLVTQKLNVSRTLRAAVAIDPAPIKDVRPAPLAQLRSSFPVLRNPGNANRTVALSAQQFRYAFGNMVSVLESDALRARYAIPGPGRPIFEVATANLRRSSPAAVDIRTEDRAPLLIVSGESDHTVPDVVARAAHRLYRNSPVVADLLPMSGRGHSLVLDDGWQDLADRILVWLSEKVEQLPATTPDVNTRSSQSD